MNNQVSEQEFKRKIAELPDEMSPERDLWSGIERAIQNKPQILAQQRHAKTPMAWAASVVAAVLLTWVVIKPAMIEQSPVSLLATMQQGFEQQKNMMLVSFGTPNLSDLPNEMQQQLNELAQARVSVEKALANDPSNTDLINILRWTQKQELDLIKQIYSPQWQTI